MGNRDLATSQIGPQATSEIATLHQQARSHVEGAMECGIRIGEILSQVRNALRHGEWLPWLASNAPFSQQMAWQYMSAFDRRAEIRSILQSGGNFTFRQLSNGSGDRPPAQLHESTFWTDSIRTSQKLKGLINGELQDHPIESWRRENWITLAAAIEPLAELYAKLKTLIA